jgi:uncharacterized protein YndB with AHSA1/START domain
MGLRDSYDRRRPIVNPVERSCLLIADISGYTSYLAGVELDHAQDILADLIGTVVTSLRPTFRLAKLEGDAAFMAAPQDQVDGSLLLDAIERCYFGFRRRRRDVRQATSCECDACIRIPDLNLKFVAHVGPVVRQDMAGLEELIGRDVIVVHRLLKNTVSEVTDATAYALLTDACTTAMGLDPVALGMRPHSETYEIVGEIPGWVHDLERRWQQEDARARVRVAPEDAGLVADMPTSAPPQLVWEFITKPGGRVAWSTGVTEVITEGAGNRRTVGATNHCMHGSDEVLEEILDWRPYDYVTYRSTMQTPGGPVTFDNTMELEPTTEGTIVHMRFAPPATEREQGMLAGMQPMFEGMFAANTAALRSLLDSEMAERAAADRAEPALPVRSPDGVLSALAASTAA